MLDVRVVKTPCTGQSFRTPSFAYSPSQEYLSSSAYKIVIVCIEIFGTCKFRNSTSLGDQVFFFLVGKL